MKDILTRSLAVSRRRSTMLKRRYSKARHYVPPQIVRRYNQARSVLTEYRRFVMPVVERTSMTNIYHCSEHKSGSQWIMSVLSDPVVFRYSGLSHFHYQSRTDMQDLERISERFFPKPFPPHSIVSPLYVNYPHFQLMPKPPRYRAFFVMRDPRDLVVSWYYSARDNHIVDKRADNPLVKARADLQRLPAAEGLVYAIDYWKDRGRFDALASWAVGAPADDNVTIVPYEDLVSSEGAATMRRLFDFLDIRIPPAEFEELIDSYSFKRLTGRESGTEDTRSHLRSGRAGDWKRHFDDDLIDVFYERTGDLVETLGYQR